MEYPGSLLTKIYRRVLFIFFLILFLLISPIIVMYAVGYRYDLKNGLFHETGAISIDIEPNFAKAYVNDIEIENKMPARIKNISPNKYHLRLSADGYYDLEKDIEVKNKQTVYLKEISLLKKQQPTQISADQTSMLSLAPNGNLLIYTTGANNVYEIHVLDTNTGENQKLSRRVTSMPIISWSNSGENFYLVWGEKPYSSLLLFDVSRLDSPWEIKDAIDKVFWQETNGAEIIYGTKRGLFTARSVDRKISTIAKNNFVDWYADSGEIWAIQFVRENKQFQLIKDALGSREKFYEFKNITDENATFEILDAKDEIALIKNKPEQIMIASRDRLDFVNADRWLVSPYNNWWLFWTPWELTTYTRGEIPYLQTRSGEGLREVIPIDKYNTLAMVWDKKVEVLFPYYSVGHTLLNNSVESIAVNSKNKTLYFSAKINDKDGIWKLEY